MIVEALPPETWQTCQMCGEEAELRPYGIGGLFVCFKCGMKNVRIAQQAFEEQSR